MVAQASGLYLAASVAIVSSTQCPTVYPQQTQALLEGIQDGHLSMPY